MAARGSTGISETVLTPGATEDTLATMATAANQVTAQASLDIIEDLVLIPAAVVTASDTTLASDDGQEMVTGAALVMVKEFYIIRPGTYRCYAELVADGAHFPTYRIYRDGVAYGALHTKTAPTGTWEAFTDDLIYVTGEYCQLYLSGGGAGLNGYIRNFRLRGTPSAGYAVVTA